MVGGTGIAVTDRHVLTARHVVDDMVLDETIVLPQPEGVPLEASVVGMARHEDHDLAIITIEESGAKFEPPQGLVTRDPNWSDTIHLLGFPPVPMSSMAYPTVQIGEYRQSCDNHI